MHMVHLGLLVAGECTRWRHTVGLIHWHESLAVLLAVVRELKLVEVGVQDHVLLGGVEVLVLLATGVLRV